MLNSTSTCRLLRTTAPIASRRLIHVTPITRSGSTPGRAKDLHLSQVTTGPGQQEGVDPREQQVSASGHIRGIKQALGLASSRDVKHDDRRAFHTTAVALTAAEARADPTGAHLRHKQDDKPDTGRGSAGVDPTLSSQTSTNAPSAPLKNQRANGSGYVVLASARRPRHSYGTGSTGGFDEFHTFEHELNVQAWPSPARAGTSYSVLTLARRPMHSYGTGSTGGFGEFHTSAHERNVQTWPSPSRASTTGSYSVLALTKRPRHSYGTGSTGGFGEFHTYAHELNVQTTPSRATTSYSVLNSARRPTHSYGTGSTGGFDESHTFEHEHNIQTRPSTSRNGSNNFVIISVRRPKNSYGTGSTSGFGEIHTSALVHADTQQHSAKSYLKDVDNTLRETPDVYKIDSSSDTLDSKDRE